jgi:hypothetical protein
MPPGASVGLTPQDKPLPGVKPLRRPANQPVPGRLLYDMTPEMITDALTAAARGEVTDLPACDERPPVRLVNSIRATIAESGLNENEIQALYQQLAAVLSLPERVSRLPRWSERPDCLLYPILVSSTAFTHFLTFVLVIEAEQQAVLVLACEHHRLPRA